MNKINAIPENYQAQPECLKDHILLVTGAGDGIGAVAAKTFAAHGATVILLGKTIPKLEKIYDDIVSAGDPEPAIYPLDLEGANIENYAEMADIIEKEFSRLDGLLHNAAMFAGLSPIAHYDISLWQKIIQTNLHAPFLLTQAMLPLLKKSQHASLLFTSSPVAHQGTAYWGAYGISKAAVDNLMGILADELELGTSVRVNSIDPGKVRTRMRALAYPGEDPHTVPLPEEIMPAYLYLMSTDSLDVNGKIIAVNHR